MQSNTAPQPQATKAKASSLLNGDVGGTIKGSQDVKEPGPGAAQQWKEGVGMKEGEENFLRNFFELILEEGISKPLGAKCKGELTFYMDIKKWNSVSSWFLLVCSMVGF